MTGGPQRARVQALSVSRPATFGESAEWYDYASPAHFWFRWRFAALLRLLQALELPRDRALRALDVGCGAGVLLSQLERATAWVVDGADLNMDALQRARAGRGALYYYDVLDEAAELAGTYDVVTLLDVLEHVRDTRPFLSALARHLRPGGHLLINVPALQAFHGPYDEAVGHLRRYDRTTLARELSGIDLRLVELRYWGLSLLPLLALRAFGRRSGGPVLRRGIEPPARWLHAPLAGLGRVETTLVRRPPCGTSLLLAARTDPDR